MNRVCYREELVLAHMEVQMGTFLSARQRLAPGLWYVYSRDIEDFYWNHACMSEAGAELDPQHLDAICRHARHLKRAPAVFRILQTAAGSFGASTQDELILDAWLALDLRALELDPLPAGLSVARVSDRDSMSAFLDVFKDAYGPGGLEDAGYCCLAESYPRALAMSSPPPGVNALHLLGRYDGQPVAIASIFCKDHLAGLYNVGTVHTCRRRHFARALSQCAMAQAARAGCAAIFLQTEPDSVLENMYRRLGFERQFLAGFSLL